METIHSKKGMSNRKRKGKGNPKKRKGKGNPKKRKGKA